MLFGFTVVAVLKIGLERGKEDLVGIIELCNGYFSVLHKLVVSFV